MLIQVWHIRNQNICCQVKSFPLENPYLSSSRANSALASTPFPWPPRQAPFSLLPQSLVYESSEYRSFYFCVSFSLFSLYRVPSIVLNKYWGGGGDKSASCWVIFGNSHDSNDNNNINNSNLHILRICYVLVTILSALHVMINLLLTTALRRVITVIPSLKGEETEAQQS